MAVLWLPVSKRVLGDEQRLLIFNSVSATQQCWPKFLMLTENRIRSSPYWRTFTHITYCFETLRKNINNYGLFVVRYCYVLLSMPKLQTPRVKNAEFDQENAEWALRSNKPRESKMSKRSLLLLCCCFIVGI